MSGDGDGKSSEVTATAVTRESDNAGPLGVATPGTDYALLGELALSIRDVLGVLDKPPHHVPTGADVHAEIDFKHRGRSYYINVWAGQRPTTDDCAKQSSPDSDLGRV